MRDPSFQELMQKNHCYGCGHGNHDGLHIQSRWVDEGTAACVFQPEPHHCAASKHVVNGGLIATLVDCHAVGTAIANAYVREGRMINEGEDIVYVTGSLKVDYTSPCSIHKPIKITARVATVLGKKSIVACEVWSGNEQVGRGQVVCVRVDSDEWHTPPE